MLRTVAVLAATLIVGLTLGHAATRTFAEVGHMAASTCSPEGCE